jgi:hypothetical protein
MIYDKYTGKNTGAQCVNKALFYSTGWYNNEYNMNEGT